MNREKKGIISHVRNNVDSYCKACRNDSNPVGPVPNRFFLVSLSSFRICCAAASSLSPRGRARPQPPPARAWGLGPRREHALLSPRAHPAERVLPPPGSPSPALAASTLCSACCRRRGVPPLLARPDPFPVTEVLQRSL